MVMKKTYNSPATNVAVSRIRASILAGSNGGIQNTSNGAQSRISIDSSGSGGNQGSEGDEADARILHTSLDF